MLIFGVKNFEEKLKYLKTKNEIARKMCDVLITQSEYLFEVAKKEDNKLTHWLYFHRALKIQKRGINYLMKAGKYMDEYFKIRDNLKSEIEKNAFILGSKAELKYEDSQQKLL